MTIYYRDDFTTVYHGDCIKVMRKLPDNSVDSIVTDPPYGLGFLGAEWDALPPGKEWADECLRLLKPGGHLLAFGGTRTWHRLAVAVEDAGFEIRDSIMWLHGNGLPKNHNVSKAIAKNGGAVNRWEGWGTALKPAVEPIVMARKPFKGSVANNVLEHGTGALNIDAARISVSDAVREPGATWKSSPSGRWPANVILDEHTAPLLDEQSGDRPHSYRTSRKPGNSGHLGFSASATLGHADTGGASRFFYVAKASKKERPEVNGVRHITVKPLILMRYLIRMVTPPGGTTLDPFAGSGATLEAAILDGFRSIGIELADEYMPLIRHRIDRSMGTMYGETEISDEVIQEQIEKHQGVLDWLHEQGDRHG